MTDVAGLHRIALDQFAERVHAVRPDQWSGPTPCADWDVRALLNHLVYEQRWAVPLLHGEPYAAVGDRFEGDLLGDDPVATWDDAAAGARAAWGEPGAWDRTVSLSRGATATADYGFEMIVDLVVHGWDLAAAIGASRRFDPAVVSAILPRVESLAEVWQSVGIFDPPAPVPADADEMSRLLAFTGRSPDWTIP